MLATGGSLAEGMRMRITAVVCMGAGRIVRGDVFAADVPRTPWGDPDLRGTYKQGYEIHEYACHEGNYGLANMLSAARAQERAKREPKR